MRNKPTSAKSGTDFARLDAMTDADIDFSDIPRVRPDAFKRARVMVGGAVLDVKVIRRRLHQSQDAFAAMIGVPVGTIRNWEQRRRRPTGAALALLRVCARAPKAVSEALAH